MCSQSHALGYRYTKLTHKTIIPYSRKIWQFGGLCYNRQIKIRQNFLLTYIRMAILYRTAKFRSANILAIAILPNFIFCQYFRLYDIILLFMCTYAAVAAEGSADHDLNVPFQIRVKLLKATCANTVGDQLQEKVHVYSNIIVLCV